MSSLKKIAVFCGSSSGAGNTYIDAARSLAAAFISAEISLIYGGAKVGLMGELADAMLSARGEVIGVMPKFLMEKELAHTGITKLNMVNSMHERKALMAELADGFIMLPGGTGSLDEFFEILTWAQLGFHNKPCGILNVENYYDDLLRFLDHAVEKNFLSAVYRNMIIVESSPQKLLEKFYSYKAPTIVKWVKSSDQT